MNLRSHGQNAAFATSEKRIPEQKLESEKTPGPGQYASQDIINKLAKRVWGKQGVFGSTERRFAQISSTVFLYIFYYKTKENTRTRIL